jgi:hypothetical protein
MKTKLLIIIAILGFLTLDVQAKELDKKQLEFAVKLGMFIEKNQEEIRSWSRFWAFKAIQSEAEKYDCSNLAVSKNGFTLFSAGGDF